MSWMLLFFLAGVGFLSAWAYFELRAYGESRAERGGELGLMGQGQGEVTVMQEHDSMSVPETFNEARIQLDLERLARTPGMLAKYLAQAELRFTKAREIAVLQRWAEFYQVGEQVIRARTNIARAHGEFLQVGTDNQVKGKEKDARMAALEAEIAESELRAAEARKKRESLSQPAQTPTTESKLTREEQRILKKANIETIIARLRLEKTRSLEAVDASDEEERMRIMNLYDDRIAREQDELRKYL
jgi:hypothetical protein